MHFYFAGLNFFLQICYSDSIRKNYKQIAKLSQEKRLMEMVRFVAIILSCMAIGLLSFPGQLQAAEAVLAKKIVINIPNRSLSLYVDGKKIYMFPVGIGKPSSKTPLGEYEILSKEVNPIWIKPEDEAVRVESGVDNPLGYRWMEFKSLYGIHGTNNPSSIGGYVSNGCVRMKEADVEVLYDLVPVGTPVEIIYSRLIIEKNPQKIITYYIYPDVYGYQPLDVEKVNKALAGFGLECFVSDQSIVDKLAAEDGQPTYIARVVKLVVAGKKIEQVGAAMDNMVYLPAVAIAEQLKTELQWDKAKGLLTSPYGSVPGYVKKDRVYFNAADAEKLFALERDWQNPELLELNRKAAVKTAALLESPEESPAAALPAPVQGRVKADAAVNPATRRK